jgi:hypothetical protein
MRSTSARIFLIKVRNLIKPRKKTSEGYCLLYLQSAEYAVKKVRGTSAAPSVIACTTVVLVVKRKTGKIMDTRRSARN